MGNGYSKIYVHQLNEPIQRPGGRNLNNNVSFFAPLIDLLTTVNTTPPSSLSPPTPGEIRFREGQHASTGLASPGLSPTARVKQMAAATPGQTVFSHALADAVVKPFEEIESIWIKNSKYHRDHVNYVQAQLVAYHADRCRLNGLVYEKNCERSRLREEDEEEDDEVEPELPKVERIAIDILTQRIGYKNKFGDKPRHK